MPAGMRVQLQQQRGGRTIHHASEVLQSELGAAVTVVHVSDALRRLRESSAIPRGERVRADAALARSLQWATARPPAGVSGRFSKSFYFSPETPGDSWRFDVEGLQGTHLQQ